MRFPRIAVVAVVGAWLLVVPAQAAAEPQARIVSGGPTTQPWPAQTSVRSKIGNTTTNCGGTLVSARWVLTAAHCVTAANGDVVAPGTFTLRVGSLSRESGGLESTVDAVNRHPSFSDPPGGVPNYDLALLHLVQTAPQAPLRLVGLDTASGPLWAPGIQATIIGWGRTSDGGPQSPTLLEAKVPLYGDAPCASSDVWDTDFNPSTMVCAGGGAADTCPGDSGGPLMAPRREEFTLVGITSWGSNPCGKLGVPGVYTRLGDPALDGWVRTTVPTVSFTTSPATPVAGEPATLTATTTAGGSPAVVWDTNGDGTFDASGASVGVTFPSSGTTVVGVKAGFPDAGDSSSLVRDVVTVAAAPPPLPPPLAPPAAAPPPAAQPVARALTNGVGVTSRMKLTTLRVSGVRVRYECEQACTIKGALTIGPVGAKRFGLGGKGKPVTIATGSARLTESGSATLTLRLTKRAKSALRNRDRATLSLRTELRAGAAPLVTKSPIAVRR